MTELLSQAYSRGQGRFFSPPWMKVLIRNIHDPLSVSERSSSGAINIIDLANYNSCSFIATDDVGKINEDEKSMVILLRMGMRLVDLSEFYEFCKDFGYVMIGREYKPEPQRTKIKN